jgi:hypothetical protein
MNQARAASAQAVPNAMPVRLNPRGLGSVVRDVFFSYATGPLTFAVGNENQQPTIVIQQDAHFVCCSSCYTNTAEVGNNTATTAVPFVRVQNGGALVQLTDGGNTRFMSNVQVPLTSLFGSGELPHIWEFTHLFRANTTIGINITGMNNAAPFAGQVIRLTFHGFKIPVGSLPALGL